MVRQSFVAAVNIQVRVTKGMGRLASPAASFAGVGSDAMRRQNLSAILRRIHAHGPASRSTLAALTGLNRSTVGARVGELVERGLVEEAMPAATGLPGRPSPIVAVRPRGAVVLAIELSVDSLAVALIGLGGTILAHRRVSRSRQSRTVDAVMTAIAGEAALQRRGAAEVPLIGVGVAVAGVVRRPDGFLVVAPNLGWRDVPLLPRLRAALQLDIPIAVGNDADLVTLAEHMRGVGEGTADFICLWGEAGVGAGIVSEGRPLQGRNGLAGEVGHVPIRRSGRRCHCGSRGCWETEVGEEALLRLLGLEQEPSGPATIDQVIAAAERGDPRTLAALTEVGRWLGLGLAGLVNVLDPQRIALGGLFGRLYPFVAGPIAEELRRRRLTPERDAVDVVAARLGPDAPLIGAAEIALAPLLDDPATAPMRTDTSIDPEGDWSKEVAPLSA